MNMTTVSPRGQVTIPKKIRESLKLKEGDKVIVRQVEDYIIMKKLTEGVVDKFFKKV